jgi:hypothetical protein
MTESDIRILSRKMDTVVERINDVAVDIAVLKEKTARAVDETAVVRIVDGALSRHLENCRAVKDASADVIKISGVSPAIIKVAVAVVIAALSALGGMQLGG